MAFEKVAVLGIGPNNIRNNTATSRIFSSNTQMDHWSSTKTYNIEDCTESAGKIWKSLTTNTNITPVIGSDWAVLISDPHDGEIAISVTGTIDIRQRISGIWLSISQRPLTTFLTDNQALPVEIFRYSASSFKDAFLEYEIARGNGNTEGGSLRILTDGTTSFNYSQDFTTLIADPQVALVLSINAGDIIISYTSALQTSPITFKYSLRAW
jgi:hypothetical protein